MAKAFKFFHDIIRRIVFYGISAVNIIIPKNSKRIFFTDMSVVRDNQYVLLKYLCDNNYTQDYEVFFFAEDDSFIEDSVKNHIHIVDSKIKGIYYRITSKYIFFAFGSNFMSCCSPDNQITVDLWHGFGLKKIEYAIQSAKHIIPLEKTFNRVLISSEYFRNMIKQSLHCNDKQIIIGGAPKLDGMYTEKDVLRSMGIKKENYKKIVFYLPTYRNSKRLGFEGYSSDLPLLSEENIEAVNDYLKNKSVLFVVKLHHTAQRDVSIEITRRKYSNIIFLSNDDFNIKCPHFYCALGHADALITDYSSVYQDFLLTGKPIGFIIDDIKEYSELRGFNFENPLSIMPGHHINDINDLFGFVNDLADGIDKYKEVRIAVNDLMNAYQGRENCKELLTALGIWRRIK